MAGKLFPPNSNGPRLINTFRRLDGQVTFIAGVIQRHHEARKLFLIAALLV